MGGDQSLGLAAHGSLPSCTASLHLLEIASYSQILGSPTPPASAPPGWW